MANSEVWRILRERTVEGRRKLEWVWATNDQGMMADYLEFGSERAAQARAGIFNATARDGWRYSAKRCR